MKSKAAYTHKSVINSKNANKLFYFLKYKKLSAASVIWNQSAFRFTRYDQQIMDHDS